MSILFERLRQKHRTMSYPDGAPPELPERWLGEPEPRAGNGDGNGPAGEEEGRYAYCPTGALSPAGVDAGRCIFCGDCRRRGDAAFSRRYAMARFTRTELAPAGLALPPAAAAPAADTGAVTAAAERIQLIRRLFSRSFKLRQISAGGCNACEADSNVLGTLAWDISRFGISFVASPRHADGILVTGPVTDNMRLAVEKTYRAVPAPKVVIAVGACAVSGGLYADGDGRGGLDGLLAVDLYVPGCPPHPLVILEGLLRLLGRVADLPGSGTI